MERSKKTVRPTGVPSGKQEVAEDVCEL